MQRKTVFQSVASSIALCVLAACGGGGDGFESATPIDMTPTAAAEYPSSGARNESDARATSVETVDTTNTGTGEERFVAQQG